MAFEGDAMPPLCFEAAEMPRRRSMVPYAREASMVPYAPEATAHVREPLRAGSAAGPTPLVLEPCGSRMAIEGGAMPRLCLEAAERVQMPRWRSRVPGTPEGTERLQEPRRVGAAVGPTPAKPTPRALF